ncbi:MAG TPA: hypothetical protein VKX46_01985 [Ktedonobacteraceae bacterium]|nr:hypothetical protein [Ktedonobacteraceae bacterium]
MNRRRLLLSVTILIAIVLVGGIVLALIHPWSSVAASGSLPLAAVDRNNQIYMLTSTQGWAIAENAVWRTSDGGKNWQRVHDFPDNQYFDMQSPSSAVIRPSTSPTDNALISTRDGGSSWHKDITTAHGKLYPLNLSNAQHLLYFSIDDTGNGGATYTLWHSNNGGQSWQALFTSPYADLNRPVIHATSFVSAQEGWGLDLRTNALYKTTDGGLNWQRLTAAFNPQAPEAPAPLYQTTPQLEQLGDPLSSDFGSRATYFHFFTQQDGMLQIGHPAPYSSGGVYDHVTIYITHDGGLHWQQTGAVQEQVQLNANSAIATWGVADSRTLWYQAAKPTDRFSVSHDSGAHWSKITPQMPSTYLRVINFTSSSVGWAYGYDNFLAGVGNAAPTMQNPVLLLCTDDGGQSWHEVARSAQNTTSNS